MDGDNFLQDLSKRLSTPMAFDAIMRVRCSPGWSFRDIVFKKCY